MRTTAELVGGIIEVDAAIDLAPFILTANELVTEKCDTAEADYSAERLELIERYLAAHFYTVRDPCAVSEHAGPVGATYQSQVGLFLSTSHYGQQAMLLDTNGGLAALNRDIARPRIKRTASVTWLGTEEDD